jgi:hypothetical protein
MGWGALLKWLTEGSVGPYGALTALIAVTSTIAALIFAVIYRRYLGVLGTGARPRTTPEYQAYASLRESISGGGVPARLYARWLAAFLASVDRLFGDTGMGHQTLFPHAFWLKTPAPLWTAPAFDRCMLIAAIYPLTGILAFWTFSGHVGPAEAVLRLRPDLPGWRRGLEILAIGLECLAIYQTTQTIGWKSTRWAVSGGGLSVTVAIAIAGSYEVAGAFAIGTIIAYVAAVLCEKFGAFSAPNPVSGAGAISGIVAATIVIGLAGVPAVIVGATVAGGVAVVAVGLADIVNNLSVRSNRQPAFLLLLLFGSLFLCIAAGSFLSSLNTWGKTGPMLVFLGLLPLLNAPFDWLSIGLTRALLRRGLECGGWWPLICALADAILATLIIFCLALVMVIGIQALNSTTLHAGAKPVLLLQKLFDGITTNPANPEYWWVYALLISTLIPSFANLMIGGTSLLRGIPGLSSVLLRHMPERKGVPEFDRRWIALTLTLQIFVGAVLGVGAQIGLAVGIIFYVMPWLGLGLLEMCVATADLNLPERIWSVFKGIL